MAKQLLNYIKEQPEVWEQILGSREQVFADFSHDMKDLPMEHLIFLGSGSSYIASLIAAEFAGNAAGFDCRVMTPAEALRTRGSCDRGKTLVLASSQSGKSVSTMNAIRAWKEAGYVVAGITADSSSPVAKLADLHYLVLCGEETVGPKTKGMTSTVLLLELLILEAAMKESRISMEESENIISGFMEGIKAARANIALCEKYFKENISRFKQHEHAIVIADPESSLAAREGALKLLETWYVPVFSYEVEEYTHGIQNTIEEGICNLFVISEEANSSSMEKLIAYCEEKGCNDWVISTVKGVRTKANLLELKKGGASFTAPFEILPAFQYLSAFGSEDRAIECDRPKFHDFYDLLGTKSK
ncbi:SIS domain-containing protein [Lacrimispora sp.]|uniref:SIS domain-containing protein n=1 Tax=Lacrimispora sp. TaxID=2719234 RepID=UPI0028A0BA41|nr:SIS domain-containing protein [Lacrimispora sp.]